MALNSSNSNSNFRSKFEFDELNFELNLMGSGKFANIRNKFEFVNDRYFVVCDSNVTVAYCEAGDVGA
jgi:hypothetical protein